MTLTHGSIDVDSVKKDNTFQDNDQKHNKKFSSIQTPMEGRSF